MADRNPLPPDVMEALRRGDKIAAIKLLRELSKMGLSEAKGVIEALDAAKSASRPTPAAAAKPSRHPVAALRRPREDDLGPGEVPRSAIGPAAVAIAIALAAMGAWFYLSA